MSLFDRFNEKIITQSHNDDSCWYWDGYKIDSGYGRFSYNGKNIYSHRFAYELYKGNIPNGLVIDHLCKNTSCVNPDHLRAVTQRENVNSGNTGIINKSKTHCPKGHEYNEENTYIDKDNSRRCRICAEVIRRRYD